MRKLLLILFALLLPGLFFSIESLPVQADFSYFYQTDFSKYRPGSDGSPEWFSSSMDWEVKECAFWASGADKNFVILDAAPFGKLHSTEAVLTCRQKTGEQWKIAGVVIYQNAENYWHFALVEQPDDMGGKHFVELVEMYNGNWWSQGLNPTKLSPTDYYGGNFSWEYNHSYRLKLQMDTERITGILEELDGTIRVKLGYRFDNQAVTYGKPGLDNGGFQTVFQSFRARVGEEVKLPKTNQFPPYQSLGSKAVKGKATGYFHVEERDKTWWVIDPAGNSYYIAGTDHVNYNAHWCEKLGYAPYHRNCEQIYGGEAKWAASATDRLKSWGFNTLGTGSSSSTRYRGLPYLVNLNLGTTFSATDYITPKTTWTGFPNVFSPRFPVYCDKMARMLCEPYKDDPWLVGYFLDNELEWFPNTSAGIFPDTFELPADNSAKQALVNFLKQRYAGINDFNKAWNTGIKDFPDILKLRQVPGSTSERAKADQRDFVRQVAGKYFAITTAAIRKYDPNHLILGCRFAGQSPDIWDIAGKYSDIVSVNCYRTLDLERGVMTDGFETELKQWYREAKRPLMITEWSFPALDAGLPCRHGAGQRVPTQPDRAFAFAVFQKLLFTTPFIVGSDYFMWVDQPALGISSVFPEDSNYGLVDEQDRSYPQLTQMAAELNPLVYDFHNHNTPDISISAGKTGNTLLAGNSGNNDTSGTVNLWIDGKQTTQQLKLPGKTRRVIKICPQLSHG